MFPTFIFIYDQFSEPTPPAIGAMLLLVSLLLTQTTTYLTVLLITTQYPSTPIIDILYAANWCTP